MDRPKRTIKAPKRFDDEVEPPKTKVKTPAKRTLKSKVQNSNPPVNNNPPRTLNLDLNGVAPSDDFKFSKDFGMYNNPFWVNHFFTPQDGITNLYKQATQILASILPANFQLYDDEETAFGVANLELKDEYKRAIRKIPLLSKLINGDYQTQTSKSDKNIASSIKFFINNLPSFQRYKNTDDISWVITQHRLLMAELLDYYSKQANPRIATIKSRINAMTRIFRIAYETKNYELYDKYSALVIFLTQFFEDDEFNNELSDIELKKFIPFDIVWFKQYELEQQFDMIVDKRTQTAYDLNQDLLLVSLYSLIPPLRNEVKTLKFANAVQTQGDWIVIKPDEVLMDLNEEKKRHAQN